MRLRAVVLAILLGLGHAAMAFELTSGAFKADETIPKKHTCDGEDLSPPLAWTEPPAGTKGFALVCDDPDAPAGTWIHWVIYDLPPSLRTLPEGVPQTPKRDDGSKQGTNDFKKIGYNGPCPPRGSEHRYYFTLFALDAPTGLAPGATKADLVQAIQAHTLGNAHMIGRYARP
jgi:Raf kinase inhibitor-like YbhB/YbcL family protein